MTNSTCPRCGAPILNVEPYFRDAADWICRPCAMRETRWMRADVDPVGNGIRRDTRRPAMRVRTKV